MLYCIFSGPSGFFNTESKFESKKKATDKNANTLNAYPSTSFFDTFDDSFSEKSNTLNSKKHNFLTDPFGDTKFSNLSNNNETSTGFDDFNDNFENFHIPNAPKSTSTFNKRLKQKENNNEFKTNKDFKSGYAKPVIKPRPDHNTSGDISKQDFLQDDNFDEVLAAVLERSKIEK